MQYLLDKCYKEKETSGRKTRHRKTKHGLKSLPGQKWNEKKLEMG